MLSYLELVDVAFVAAFRRLGVDVGQIRRAHDALAQALSSERPLAEQRLQSEGPAVRMALRDGDLGSVVHRLIVVADRGRPTWQPPVYDRIAEFDYEDGLALRWHPAGRASPVVIDPRIAFGAPIVRGIPVTILAGRQQAGEAPEEIAADFGLTADEVRRAQVFAGVVAAA